MRRATPLPLALVLLGTSAAAQSDWVERCERWNRNPGRETHCVERETRIPARESLAVDAGRNGGVTVEAWDQPGVRVRARIQTWAPTETEARRIASQIRVETDGTLRATGPEGRDRTGWSVSWQVHVPRRTGLEVRTHNGPISVRDVSGRMVLEAHNGPLTLHGVSGDVRGRTRNGPIQVTLHGTRWSGAGLDVETHNGPVTVRLPHNYSAELETGTVRGPLNLDLQRPILVQGRLSRRIQTRLGEGGPPIRAVTTNGPVTIRD